MWMTCQHIFEGRLDLGSLLYWRASSTMLLTSFCLNRQARQMQAGHKTQPPGSCRLYNTQTLTSYQIFMTIWRRTNCHISLTQLSPQNCLTMDMWQRLRSMSMSPLVCILFLMLSCITQKEYMSAPFFQHALQVDHCEKLDFYTHFFNPCGESPVAGQMVTCIGYAGKVQVLSPKACCKSCMFCSVVHFCNPSCKTICFSLRCAGTLSPDKAARMLVTKDFSEHVKKCKQITDICLRPSFRLDRRTALSTLSMMGDPSDGVFVSNVLNVSQGKVVASDKDVVQHHYTALPQMSGCPYEFICHLAVLTNCC